MNDNAPSLREHHRSARSRPFVRFTATVSGFAWTSTISVPTFPLVGLRSERIDNPPFGRQGVDDAGRPEHRVAECGGLQRVCGRACAPAARMSRRAGWPPVDDLLRADRLGDEKGDMRDEKGALDG